ncbi:polysaccharide biosynthesis/export family protein [Aureimonas leprariae]|uniref:Sugar transporter n=1 Tax=Plantimonas leprariae TaxID=2615207 RepID=A0A7V7PQC9_9HYPH|nr:polysaccharide biosynthesis/export family protein [Aureimonas leprariae]KAB0680356.1 sugar transporter [Aureimonas leprariae]
MVAFVRAWSMRLPLGIFLIASCASAPSTARGEVLVERGDMLRVSIAEAPKLGIESKVDVDGRIMLPQLGSMQVAGMGLDAIRARLAEEFVERDILKSPTILVEIAKYRPFYVGGRVRRPGAVDYEPGLTVRHALILGGGVGRSDGDGPSQTSAPELRARWQTYSYQLLQTNSLIARLEAELTRDEAAKPGVAPGTVPARDADALASLDEKILHDRLATWSASQAQLRDGMALLDLEIDVLKQQADLQENERDLSKTEMEAARSLVQRGLAPLSRLQDLQREESRNARDMLESEAFAARARQNRSTIDYEFKSADIKWRSDISQQLRGAMLDRYRLKAELDAVTAQIMNQSADAAEARGAPSEPVVVIYRSVGGREETIKALMDTAVLPGDILDVSLAGGATG